MAMTSSSGVRSRSGATAVSVVSMVNQPLPRTGRAPNRHVGFTVVLLRLAAQGW